MEVQRRLKDIATTFVTCSKGNMALVLYRVLSEDDALALRDAALKMEWRFGRARTEYGDKHIKKNQELVIVPEYAPMAQKLQDSLRYNESIFETYMPYKIMPPIINRYNVESPFFGRHGDSALVADGTVRSDLSCTIFLTPPEEYEGGELVVEDKFKVKGPVGTAVIYDGGQPHWVSPVTSGDRVSAVTWMQSYIRDPRQRQILSEMTQVLKNMEQRREDWDDEYTSLGLIKSNLLRMWMEH